MSSACDIKQQIKTTKFLPDITINGRRLDKNLLAREIQYHPAASFREALQQAASALILRELLREEVKEALLAGEKEEEAIAAHIDAHIPALEISDDDCRRYYTQHPERFSRPPQMQVRHILLAAAEDDADTRILQKQIAGRLIAELQQVPDLHSAFCARLHLSRCPSRETEGRLGELEAGQTVPEFERQIFALDAGLAARPIATRYGWHIVWIEHKQARPPAPYADVAGDIAAYLHARHRRRSVAGYLYGLVQKAEISGIDMHMPTANVVLQARTARTP